MIWIITTLSLFQNAAVIWIVAVILLFNALIVFWISRYRWIKHD